MTYLIYLIGRSGTGKYTIAKEIAKDGFIIVDNQLINNPIFALLPQESLNSSITIPEQAWKAIGKIRNIVFGYLEQELDNNYVLTNELFDDDKGDHRLYQQVKIMAEKRGSIFLPVKLLITEEENARRITSLKRAERYKSTKIDEKDRNRHLIKIDHPNLLELEVSNLPALESSRVIFSHLNNITSKLKNNRKN